MRTADEIRESLDRIGTRRIELDTRLIGTEQDLGIVLREANSHPEITMTEAASVALISRPMAYKLMGKVNDESAE